MILKEKRRIRMTLLIGAFGAFMYLVASIFFASIISAASNTLNFQGKIVNNSDGTNLISGSPACLVSGASNDTCDFRVRIYDAVTGGNLLFEEEHVDKEIGAYNGVFNLKINSVCNSTSTPVGNWTSTACISNGGVDFSDTNIWVEIGFAPAGAASYTEIFSRTQLQDVPSSRYSSISGSSQSVYNATSAITFEDVNTGSAIAFSDATYTALPGGYASILHALNAASGGGGGLWTINGNVTYLTSAGSDLSLSSTLVSAFSVDESDSLVRIGDGSTANGKIDFYSSTGDTGRFEYLSDTLQWSGGGFRITDDTYYSAGNSDDFAFGYNSVSGDFEFLDGASNSLVTIEDNGTTGTLSASGDLIALSSVIAGNSSNAGSFEIFDGSSNSISIISPSIASDYTLTLPTTDGDANQLLLTDGSGVLSWTSPELTFGADTGTDQTLALGDTLTITGGTGINTSTGTDEITIDFDESANLDITGAWEFQDLTELLFGTDSDFQISFDGTDSLTFTDGTNTLLSIIDVGTTGRLQLGSNTNDLLSVGTTGVGANGDLYFGDDLVCDVSESNCGWAAGGSSLFSDSGSLSYLTQTTDDFAIGASSLIAPFSVDTSDNTVRIGDGGDDALDPTLSFFASDGVDSGSLIFTDTDNFNFTGGNVGIGAANATSTLTLNGGTGTLATGIAFGDADSGFYESADDVLQIATAGTSRLQVANAGVTVLSADSSFADFEVTDTSNAGIVIDSGNGLDSALIFQENNSTQATIYWDGGVDQFYLNSNNTNTIINSGGGLLGIGTTSLDAYLDIRAATTSNAQINLTSSAGTDPTTPVAGDIWFNGTNFNFYDGSATYDLIASNNLFTDGGTTTYLTATTDDFALGGTNSSAPFFFDASAGQLTLGTTGSGAGLVIGDDTNLYDNGTNILRTDDSFEIGSNGTVLGDFTINNETTGSTADSGLLTLSGNYFNVTDTSVGMSLQLDITSDTDYALSFFNNTATEVARLDESGNFDLDGRVSLGADTTNALSVGTTGIAANGDLYYGDDLLCDVSEANCGGGGGGSSLFTDSGTITYLTQTTDDFAVGGSGLASAFSVDTSANTARIGTGATTNGQLQIFASDGTNGALTFTTGELFELSGGSLEIADNNALYLGSDSDFYMNYDETTDDRVEFGFGANQFGYYDDVASQTYGAFGFSGTTTLGTALAGTETALYINPAAGFTGSLLDIDVDGVDVLTLTPSQFTVNVPSTFTSVGNVQIANNLEFTNSTASYITSDSPLYITAGDLVSDEDLVLSANNAGYVVVDDRLEVTDVIVLGASSNNILSNSAQVNPATDDLYYGDTLICDVSASGCGITPLFTDSGTVSYLTSVTDDFAIGGTSLSATFSVDISTNLVQVGDGADTNGKIDLFASNGNSGRIELTTADAFSFQSADFLFNSAGAAQNFTISGDTISNLFFTDGTNDAVGINTGTITAGSILDVRGTSTFGGSLLPLTDDTYDLGSSSLRWRDLYLGPASLHIGTNGNEAIIGYNTSTNELEIDANGDATPDVTIADNGDLDITGNLEVAGTISGQQSATDPVTCDGTTEGEFYYNTAEGSYKVCDGINWGEFGVGANLDYIFAGLSAHQTTNLTSGNHIEFDTTDSASGLSLQTGAGQLDGIVTLTAGKTYELEAFVRNGGSSANLITSFWYDRTNGANLGVTSITSSTSSTLNYASKGIVKAVVTPVTNIDVELRLGGSSGGFTNIDNLSYMYIKELARPNTTGLNGALYDTNVQRDTTNSVVANQVVRKGWGYINGDNTNKVSEAVTYGITFDDIPIVLVSPAGYNTSGTTSTLDDCMEGLTARYSTYTGAITSTDFSANFSRDGGTLSSTLDFCYTWIAIGSYSAGYGADLAENYITYDTSLELGEVVSIDDVNDIAVERSFGAKDSRAFGIVSTSPAQVLGGASGESTDNATPAAIKGYNENKDKIDSGEAKVVPIALEGRVPVQVSLENGEIKKGDYLTTSEKPGYAAKAIEPGNIIGRALEDFDGSNQSLFDSSDPEFEALMNGEYVEESEYSELGKIMVLVERGFFEGEGDYSITSQLLELGKDNKTLQVTVAGTVIVSSIIGGFIMYKLIRQKRKVNDLHGKIKDISKYYLKS